MSLRMRLIELRCELALTDGDSYRPKVFRAVGHPLGVRGGVQPVVAGFPVAPASVADT